MALPFVLGLAAGAGIVLAISKSEKLKIRHVIFLKNLKMLQMNLWKKEKMLLQM